MISIVIIAYNEKKDIASCLMAMSKQTYREPFEVIVVDNASTDHTPEIAQSFVERLPLRVIREEHKGRGAARARGFGEAKGEIILSTDEYALQYHSTSLDASLSPLRWSLLAHRE